MEIFKGTSGVLKVLRVSNTYLVSSATPESEENR